MKYLCIIISAAITLSTAIFCVHPTSTKLVPSSAIQKTQQWCEDLKKLAETYYCMQRLLFRLDLYKKQHPENPDPKKVVPNDTRCIMLLCSESLREQLKKIIDNPHTLRHMPTKLKGYTDSIYPYQPSLNIMMHNGNYRGIKALLELGANPNHATASNIFPIFIPHTIPIAKLLHKHGVNLEKSYDNGLTLIHHLMKETFSVQTLEYYKKTNPVEISNTIQHHVGDITPLHCLVKNLPEYNVTPDAQKQWNEKLQFLLNNQADINELDWNGYTALDNVGTFINVSAPLSVDISFYISTQQLLRDKGAKRRRELPVEQS